MTNEQFDQCKLSRRVTFAESEAARLVLVHGESMEMAVGIYRHHGITEARLNDVIKMFNDSLI